MKTIEILEKEILALLADNDRLAERVRDLETAANGIVAGTVSFMAKERAAQNVRVPVLEAERNQVRNNAFEEAAAIWDGQSNVQSHISRAIRALKTTPHPHADEAAKVGLAEYREKTRIAIVDLFQRMEKSYAAEPTRRISMMDLDAVFHHVKELGLGGCLDAAAPPSPAEGKSA